MNVLLVEDDRELARQLCGDLAEERFDVHLETSGTAALEAALRGSWDLVVMDVSLPGMSGFEIVETMRERGLETPVIFLTAKGDVADRVRGLRLGGDDYLTKPFARDELKARVHALTRRRAKTRRTGIVPPKDWNLNPLLRQVTTAGGTVALQPREWSLLELFLQNDGVILTKSFLLDHVWGIQFDPGTNVVDAAVFRLRKKLDQPGKVSHLRTVRGRGYVFHRDV